MSVPVCLVGIGFGCFFDSLLTLVFWNGQRGFECPMSKSLNTVVFVSSLHPALCSNVRNILMDHQEKHT